MQADLETFHEIMKPVKRVIDASSVGVVESNVRTPLIAHEPHDSVDHVAMQVGPFPQPYPPHAQPPSFPLAETRYDSAYNSTGPQR